jgi:hypothetical protein
LVSDPSREKKRVSTEVIKLNTISKRKPKKEKENSLHLFGLVPEAKHAYATPGNEQSFHLQHEKLRHADAPAHASQVTYIYQWSGFPAQ